MNLNLSAREKSERLRQVQRELDIERAAVARRCDAIVVAAFRAVQIDLSECGLEVLVGHLVQLRAKIDDASFKSAAGDRAGPFLSKFNTELTSRGLSVAHPIDPDIDMHSTEPVPVVARLLRTASRQEIEKLKSAGLVIKIKFSTRSPALVAEGNLKPDTIAQLASSMGVRFDCRSDASPTTSDRAGADPIEAGGGAGADPIEAEAESADL